MTTYQEKLKDGRWQRKRLAIMELANFKCEDCGTPNGLEIHHCAYIKGKEPWEYDVTLLMCLCGNCHVSRQSREDAIKVHLAKRLRITNPTEIETAAWEVIDLVTKIVNEKYAEAFS